MPHIILEHSDNIHDNIDIKNFLKQAIDTFIAASPTPTRAFKARRIVSKEYYLGDGNEDNFFIHLSVNLLTGREKHILEKIAKDLKEFMHKSFPKSDKISEKSFSLEIREMDRNFYQH
jgi:5-carboxymethyl-2-hydroxymuconate isomerase